MWEQVLVFLAVFIAAATPWLEVLLVIPPAILAGLDPTLTALVAFAGNLLTVLLVIHGWERWSRWRAARAGGSAVPVVASAKSLRAERLMQRYGVPGLALGGPLLIGIHLAAVIAVGLGARRAQLVGWMSLSLAGWTLVVTLLSVAGAAHWLPGAG